MKLTKSNNKVIAGCLGGIAQYLGWDPTLVRIIYALLTIFSGAFPGVIIYIILFFVMPLPSEK